MEAIDKARPCQQTQGLIFFGTPHKGTWLTFVAKLITLFGHWRGSSTRLLEIMDLNSSFNEQLHKNFVRYLPSACGTANIVCVFEAVKESVFGLPIIYAVDKNSAVIDGSRGFGIERDHRNIQRFASQNDGDYKEIRDWIRRWVNKVEAEAQALQADMARKKTQSEQACMQMNMRESDITDKAAETCAWLLNHEKYTAWLNQHQGLLWIKGKPGAGKSTLMKYALRETKERASRTKLVVASFFFHGRGAPLQKTPFGLFRSLLHQVLDQIPELLSKFYSIFKKKCETQGEPGKDWEWHVTELRKFLEDTILDASKACSIRLYIDALDECGEKDARDLIAFFESLTSKLAPIEALGICFSCRHYPILALERGLTICMEDENHLDIVTYVEGRLHRGFSDLGKAIDLTEKIVEKASGVFQWVVLVVSIVLQLHLRGTPMKAILKKLEEIPPELENLYRDLLGGIEDEDRTQTLLLMQWICFAREPLSMDELRFAMAVDADCPYKSLSELQNSPNYVETGEEMERRVKNLSGGLAEIKSSYRGRRIAQLIHQSVKDYLIQSGLQNLDSPSKHSIEGGAHFRLSRSCIRYITMEEVLSYHSGGELDLEGSEDEQDREVRYLESKFPFLRYATTEWVLHAASVEAEGITQEDLLALFQWPSHNVLESWTRHYQMMNRYSDDCPGGGTTLLHVASQHGLFSVVAAVVDSESNTEVDSKDEDGRTPLSWAALYGQEAVVKLLVERDDVYAESQDEEGLTPLLWAVIRGHKAVVKLLVERGDVNADSKDEWGQTPLSWAACSGREAVVKLLVERDDVNADSKNKYGQTPLSLAARSGQAAVVRLLLERGASVDLKDKDGRTPLSLAVEKGHQKVVELLESYIQERLR
ncbi:hypothetical protein H2201_007058 [Coniosporium apollinis]|uniref:NACHT domain-containing protein n=1 Tax=Coniosporium apollinis TaxID=61459 RepID=A0ABQ9NK48_9PEZI|nr:hypothetical protein H2201_007058 [Coniosporium apollinis]